MAVRKRQRPVSHGLSGLLRRLHGKARRFGWGVVDQAVSSLTNAAVSIYVARELGAVQFGAFSLAYVTYSLVLNASRGLATDPLTVRYSSAELPVWRRAVASSTGTATVTGAVAAPCVLGVAVVLNGTTKEAFVALGMMLPGLMLQDSWRFAFFALGRGSQACLNDTIWAAVMVPALVLLQLTHHSNVFSFVLAWGAAANIAAAAGPLQARVIPRPDQVWAWISQHRDLGTRYLAENTANSGSAQLRTYGIGLILGLAAIGYLQAAGLLMGPFLAVLMGILLVTVPEAARVLQRSPKRLWRFCLLLGAGLALAALAWGGALMLLLPYGLGHWLIGPIWRPVYPLMLPTIVWFAGTGAWVGASAGLRALGASRRSLFAQTCYSIGFVVISLVGAYYGGAMGAAVGSAVAVVPGVVLWWWQLRLAMRDAGIEPRAARHARPATALTMRNATTAAAVAGGQMEARTLRAQPAIRPVPEGIRPTRRTPGAAGWVQPGHSPSSPRAGAVGTRQFRPPNGAERPFRPATWTVVVSSDRTHYDRMWISHALSGSMPAFPVFGAERRFMLTGNRVHIGRRSAARNHQPEIDLSLPLADPGVSRLHAILIAGPDGTWSVVDPGSANGTLLNGRKIRIGELIPLCDGDCINLGAWTVITVHRRWDRSPGSSRLAHQPGR
jgi:O-antigen/teichoic acid export membrane protein